jgi:integrase
MRGKSIYNVQPLRTQEEIDDLKWSLERYCSPRDLFLFVFGINTGLRVSDLLPLRVSDVRDRTHIVIIEKKTGKKKRFPILALQQEIMRYTAGMRADEYLFASRKGNDPITTTQAYRALVKAADMIDRNDIGTHTMRKTFGYHYYKRTKDIVTLMEIFNHSAPSITKRYIGITQDEIDQSLRDFLL